MWMTKEHRPMTYGGLSIIFRHQTQCAGLKDARCSVYAFHHTTATMSLENGAGEFQVQSILGHSTLTITHRFVATLNSEKVAEAHK